MNLGILSDRETEFQKLLISDWIDYFASQNRMQEASKVIELYESFIQKWSCSEIKIIGFTLKKSKNIKYLIPPIIAIRPPVGERRSNLNWQIAYDDR